MKSLKTIQTLSKIGRVLSKIAFIMSLVGFCGCVAGLIGLGFGNISFIKIGGVTLRGLISENSGYSIKSINAALSGWMIVCAGEAVTAKFAEIYFKNELKAGTPFTLDGASELMRLGILTIAVPTGCTVVGSIAEGIIVGFADIEKTASMNIHFDSSASIILGVMFIVISLICRYGADIKEGVTVR